MHGTLVSHQVTSASNARKLKPGCTTQERFIRRGSAPRSKPLSFHNTIYDGEVSFHVHPMEKMVPSHTYRKVMASIFLNYNNPFYCFRESTVRWFCPRCLERPFKYLNSNFLYPVVYYKSWYPYSFIYLQPDKVPLSTLSGGAFSYITPYGVPPPCTESRCRPIVLFSLLLAKADLLFLNETRSTFFANSHKGQRVLSTLP